MTSMLAEKKIVLLVEDNPGEALLVREILSETERDPYHIEHVSRLSQAIALLRRTEVDVVILDLRLPDGSGVDSVRAIHGVAQQIPIVVLTGAEDEHLAMACIDAGAQDYLQKAEVRSQNLKRAIGYAITRVREAQLREMKQMLDSYRSLSSSTQNTTVTASLAGSGSISLRNPETFETIVRNYFALIESYMAKELDGSNLPRAEMELIATALGDANAGPRDLLDVHIVALDRAITQYDERHSRMVVFEARLLALQMMGLLVDYYRVGHRRRFVAGVRG